MVEKEYYELLKCWCDTLLEYQLHNPEKKQFHGAFLCPSCMKIHGRCHDAVYPLLYMADATGEDKYKKAAMDLFEWGENMICDDGSFYNDAQSTWNGITVFSVISICDSLRYHGHLLDQKEKSRFEERMRRGAAWIYRELITDYMTNINYHASAAAAMALVGNYFGIPEYLNRAKQLADFCMEHFTQDGFLYGEGQPREEVTSRECRPVDIGYNAEESLPALLIYSREAKDRNVLVKVKQQLYNQLDFMLPDGAWDNSFGSRNFKWTYWGSRTSDGCQSAYGTWRKEEPVFSEAARRNLDLYKACTHNGLLYGGPGYYEHGEEPCIHHTFSHASALAFVLDNGIEDTERTLLPSENAEPVRYFPTVDTYKISFGGFLASLTGYDFEYMKGGHASGGSVTLLWHKYTGPLLCSSMTVYSMKEVHNMQLSRKKEEHQPLNMRVEYREENKIYSQSFDYNSKIQVQQRENIVSAEVEANLVDMEHRQPGNKMKCILHYVWEKNCFHLDGKLNKMDKQAVFILPIIGRHKDGYEREGQKVILRKQDAVVSIETQNEIQVIQPVFFLATGFEAWKLVIIPDQSGFFEFTLKIKENK